MSPIKPTPPEERPAPTPEEELAIRLQATDLYETAIEYVRKGFLTAGRSMLHASAQLVHLTDDQRFQFYLAVEEYRKDAKMKGL